MLIGSPALSRGSRAQQPGVLSPSAPGATAAADGVCVLQPAAAMFGCNAAASAVAATAAARHAGITAFSGSGSAALQGADSGSISSKISSSSSSHEEGDVGEVAACLVPEVDQQLSSMSLQELRELLGEVAQLSLTQLQQQQQQQLSSSAGCQQGPGVSANATAEGQADGSLDKHAALLSDASLAPPPAAAGVQAERSLESDSALLPLRSWPPSGSNGTASSSTLGSWSALLVGANPQQFVQQQQQASAGAAATWDQQQQQQQQGLGSRPLLSRASSTESMPKPRPWMHKLPLPLPRDAAALALPVATQQQHGLQEAAAVAAVAGERDLPAAQLQPLLQLLSGAGVRSSLAGSSSGAGAATAALLAPSPDVFRTHSGPAAMG